MKYEVIMNGQSTEVVQALAMSILFVRQKILFVYTYATYNSQNDIQWAREKSKEFVKLILDANLQTPSELTGTEVEDSSPKFNFSGAVSKTIGAFGATLLIFLIYAGMKGLAKIWEKLTGKS